MPPAPRNRQQRPTPNVYRNRRIAALIIVALLLWGIVSGVMWVAGEIGKIFTPATAPTISAGQPCASGDVVVEAIVGSSDKVASESFAMGSNPYLWFQLTNIGSVDCTFNAGEAVQFFTIKSGNDLIWTSRECDRTGLTDNVITLSPNAPVSSAASAWLRVRSSSSGCGADQSPVDAGAYNLTVEVGGVLSETNQFLLG
jgi:hypothetical protein